MPIPLVVAHAGYSPYLEFTLRQAAVSNPESEIILLGDAANDRFPSVRHVDAAPFAGVRLGAAYRHRSTNGEAFERACFDRWLVLEAFLEAERIPEALVLDSDVMLYATAAEIRATHLAGADVALSLPVFTDALAWAASPHASFWTAPALADFCGFVRASFEAPFEPYEAKWQHHVENGLGGGVCDMTALHLWAEARRGVANLAEVRQDTAFDHNLSLADNAVPGEYRTDRDGKALAWQAGRPVGFNTRLGAPVRLYGLHCQGHAKARIPRLYRGPAFPGQAAAARRIRAHYALRRPASRVVQPLRSVLGRLRS